MESIQHAVKHRSVSGRKSAFGARAPLVPLALAAIVMAGPLEGQARPSGERASASIRIGGGVVRIGNRPAGSLRSFSDRGGLARIIGDRLEGAGDPRAARFGPAARDLPRSGRSRRSLRGGYYDPYPYDRDIARQGSSEYDPDGPGHLAPPPVPAIPVTLGRAYDLGGPPSFTAIRVHDQRFVGGGFRLQPLPLPTLVVYAPCPIWRGSLFDVEPTG